MELLCLLSEMQHVEWFWQPRGGHCHSFIRQVVTSQLSLLGGQVHRSQSPRGTGTQEVASALGSYSYLCSHTSSHPLYVFAPGFSPFCLNTHLMLCTSVLIIGEKVL